MSQFQNPKPEIRYLNELKDVLYDQNWLRNVPNSELYYIWRGKEKGDLRYDITVIPAEMLGKEFIKTKGHYHRGNYGELFKVISGQGIFLFQKKNLNNIKDVYFVEAKRGDFVISPPKYGHLIINSGKEVLKVSNWISKKCKSDYKSVERRRGFCYYYTRTGWIKNKNYKRIPKLHFEKPQKSMPKNLGFLYGNL